VFACALGQSGGGWLFSQARSMQDERENNERDDPTAKPLDHRAIDVHSDFQRSSSALQNYARRTTKKLKKKFWI